MEPVAPPDLAFVGLARSGKDTAAGILGERYGYRRLAFADPLREMAERLNPIVTLRYGRLYRYREALAESGYDNAKKVYGEVRRVLQVLGTEAVREVLGDSVWVDHLLARADAHRETSPAPLVVTDARYANEVDALRSRGFLVVRITRPGAGAGVAHVSEALATDPSFRPDAEITNDGDLGRLEDRLTSLVDAYALA